MARQPAVLTRFIVEGHIIGKILYGDGSARDGEGRCLNMLPQSESPNLSMGSAEKQVKELAKGTPGEHFFYLVVAPRQGGNFMPIGMFPFVLSHVGTEQFGPFLNDAGHIAFVGMA